MTTTGQSRISLTVLTALVAASCAGCGTQAYEERLQETARYYTYRQRVDTALEKVVWKQFGVEFRPPKGFREIPGPTEEAPHDMRQPPFINRDLPGLLGAWQGETRIDVPGLEADSLRGFIFLCTNHSRFLELDDENPPMELRNDVAEVLGPALGFDPPSVTPWTFEEVRAPRGTAYVKRKTYDWILLDRVTRNIDAQDIEMDFRLYRYDVGEIQLVLVSAIPQEDLLDPRERIYSGLEIAMETLQMTGDIPRRQAGGQSSGGGF